MDMNIEIDTIVELINEMFELRDSNNYSMLVLKYKNTIKLINNMACVLPHDNDRMMCIMDNMSKINSFIESRTTKILHNNSSLQNIKNNMSYGCVNLYASPTYSNFSSSGYGGYGGSIGCSKLTLNL